jgi:methylenetetrahydrofolate--tRNA-(uracil-5-)-methyltransferase
MANSGPVVVIGAGLAGAEAALQLARRGIPVRLFEMKPQKRTPAQNSDLLAELVCSNSFRASSTESAVGAIKEEMRLGGSILMRFADQAQVPAGGALAVDREKFSAVVTQSIIDEPNIELISEEVESLERFGRDTDVVVATGPLTSSALAQNIVSATGGLDKLYFYDAIAPIVAGDSIDESRVFSASRYGKGDGDDYINCPMDKPAYEAFVDAVLGAEKVAVRAFEEPKYFEGCLPIETIAERGREALRFGCMKPVGLTDPRTGRWPYAAVQLRMENTQGTAWNLVGFQTRMKWGDQKEVFRMIPGLENAEFLRMGSVHRNTYIDAPSLLDEQLRLRPRPNIRFAGQITGVEGYVESTAIGLMVAWFLIAERTGLDLTLPPEESTMGALVRHALGKLHPVGKKAPAHTPSNIHWGLCPPLEGRIPKKERKQRYGQRAVNTFEAWFHRSGLGSDANISREAVMC